MQNVQVAATGSIGERLFRKIENERRVLRQRALEGIDILVTAIIAEVEDFCSGKEMSSSSLRTRPIWKDSLRGEISVSFSPVEVSEVGTGQSSQKMALLCMHAKSNSEIRNMTRHILDSEEAIAQLKEKLAKIGLIAEVTVYQIEIVVNVHAQPV